MLYGTDYTGTVCDGTDRSGLKYLTYPRMNDDVLAAVAKIGSSSDLLSNLESVKFYGVCVSSCPVAGDYVCNLDGVSALRDDGFSELSATDGLVTDAKATAHIKSIKSQSPLSLFDSTSRTIYNGCWANYLDTRSIFYRCLPIYDKNETMTVTCTEPDNVDADDPRCQVKSVVSPAALPTRKGAGTDASVPGLQTRTTTTKEPAQDNMLAEKLDAASSMWGRWMGDVANTWCGTRRAAGSAPALTRPAAQVRHPRLWLRHGHVVRLCLHFRDQVLCRLRGSCSSTPAPPFLRPRPPSRGSCAP